MILIGIKYRVIKTVVPHIHIQVLFYIKIIINCSNIYIYILIITILCLPLNLADRYI